VSRQEFLGVVEDSAISFGDFTKEWQKRVLGRVEPSTATRWKGIVENHLKPHFKGSLRGITLASVETYIAKRIEDLAARAKAANPKMSDEELEGLTLRRHASLNREITVLRHILKRAVRWNFLTRNPIEGWHPLKEAPGRTRFLSEEEIESLLAACADSRSAFLRPFVLVALNTGLRRGEILGLNRRSIDWQNRTVTISKTKNGTEGHVPLNMMAFEALRSLPARIDGRLFPLKDGHTVTRAFGRACDRAGIEDFHLHDLRHTFASFQALAGVQQRGLQALLRHKDTRMIMRYSHLTDTYLRTAVDAVNLGAPKPGATAFEGVMGE